MQMEKTRQKAGGEEKKRNDKDRGKQKPRRE